MTTTTTPHGTAASTHADVGRAVLAEWTKFRTVRSSFWTLVISAALTIGIAAAYMPQRIDLYEGPADRAARAAAVEGWWFEGLHVGILAVSILGVLVASSEYGTGTIRVTLAAVPSRWRVVTAKVVSFGAVTFVVGAVQAVAVFLVTRPILTNRSIDVPLTDPDALRGVLLAALAIMGAGLFGLGAGLLIRHSAGAIGVVVGVMWVVSALALLLPDSWANVEKALPAAAMYTMFTPTADSLGVWAAAAVFFGYGTVLLTIAGLLFARRDS